MKIFISTRIRIMVDKPENNEKHQNYIELTESQIFEKIKEDLNPIQENLAEKKITINEAKSELKKINEWLQWTKLEDEDKKEIWTAFEKLINLEKNIDENTLKNEVDKIINLVEALTKKDLANLKRWIQHKQRWNPERPPEVQEWIDIASNNLENLPKEDNNIIANRALNKIHEYLQS